MTRAKWTHFDTGMDRPRKSKCFDVNPSSSKRAHIRKPHYKALTLAVNCCQEKEIGFHSGKNVKLALCQFKILVYFHIYL